MVSHLFYYQLALLALVWLFLMLHVTWPKRGVTPPPASAKPEPIPPKRPRANEPKPFEGLTQKPHCVMCEHDAAHAQPPRAAPPDSMPPTHRRPRIVDTSQHFCPHAGCDYWGWLGLGNLRANGHPSGGPWRQLHCLGCNGYFLETHGTIFHGKQASAELIVRVHAWPKAWASVRQLGCLRSTRTLCCNGWSKPPNTSRPLRATYSATCTSISCHSMSCTR